MSALRPLSGPVPLEIAEERLVRANDALLIVPTYRSGAVALAPGARAGRAGRLGRLGVLRRRPCRTRARRHRRPGLLLRPRGLRLRGAHSHERRAAPADGRGAHLPPVPEAGDALQLDD